MSAPVSVRYRRRCRPEPTKVGPFASRDALGDAVGDLARDGTSPHGAIATWDVDCVTSMNELFEQMQTFNADLSRWVPSAATTMHRMFFQTLAFNADLNAWNVARVTTTGYMFTNAQNFNSDLHDWDTARVTDMSFMFSGSTNFNGDVRAWDTGNVEMFTAMFQDAASFNSDIMNWDTSRAIRSRKRTPFKGTRENGSRRGVDPTAAERGGWKRPRRPRPSQAR